MTSNHTIQNGPTPTQVADIENCIGIIKSLTPDNRARVFGYKKDGSVVGVWNDEATRFQCIAGKIIMGGFAWMSDCLVNGLPAVKSEDWVRLSIDTEGRIIAKHRRFPGQVNTVGQFGGATKPREGVNVSLTIRDGKIICAEVYSDDEEEYAPLGITIHEGHLSDYDGAFELPVEVATFLMDEGITVGCDFWPEGHPMAEQNES